MKVYIVLFVLCFVFMCGCVGSSLDSYNQGYEEGLNGNSTVYQYCVDYHGMYFDEHPSTTFVVLTGGHTNDDRMEYCRGYMHGYNKMLDDEKKNQIESNISKLV